MTTTVTGTPDPAVVQRQNQLSDLYTRFAVQHENEPDYDPDDDPDFVRQARQIMGLPPLAAAAQTAAVTMRTLTAFAVAELAGPPGRACMLTVSHEFCRGADGLPIHPGPCRGVKEAVKTVASDIARAPAAPRARKAATPKPAKAVPKLSASTLTDEEKQRATKLIKKDPMIFPSARERLGRVSTSGLLSNEDAAWLEDLFQREPAYANHVAQQARVDNLLARQAKAAGKTPAAYKREQAARLKQAVDGKPIAVRVADESALQGILRDGRMRTSHEKGIKRAPTLGTDLRARRLAEAVNGTPEDTPDDKRPIYGYVAVNGVEPALEPGRKTPGIAERQGQEDVLSVYGKIQVVLRPKVRDRTTVTVGDSLDELPYVRPSPIDNPSADSIGLHDLDSPDFTRTGYIEAQVHDGVTVDDIAAVVFPSQPSPATIEQLKAHGIPWRVLGRDDKPLPADQFDNPAKGSAVPSARPPRARVSANIPDQDPVVRARQRQADIDHVRARADLVAEAAKLIDYEATPETLAHKLRADAERRGITDAPEVKALLAAADSHDTAKLQKAMRQLTKRLNVQQRGEPGQIVPFDGREMRHIGGAPARGTFVHVIRPGFLYTPKGDTEPIPIIKTDVEQATPEEIAAHRGQIASLPQVHHEFCRGQDGLVIHPGRCRGAKALAKAAERAAPAPSAPAAKPAAARKVAPKPAVTKPAASAARYHSTLDDMQGLADVVEHGKIVHEGKLGGGESADTRRRTYADGTKTIWKKSKTQAESDAEQLGSLVARALGLHAPRVYRNEPKAVNMDLVPGTVAGDDPKMAFGGVRPEILKSKDGRLMGLLDILTSGADRNNGNWIIRDDGRLAPIDHGFSFMTPTGQRRLSRGKQASFVSSVFGQELIKVHPTYGHTSWADNEFTPQDIEEIRRRLAKLRPEFDQLKRGGWHKFMMDRLGAIQEHAKGKQSQLAPSLLGEKP